MMMYVMELFFIYFHDYLFSIWRQHIPVNIWNSSGYSGVSDCCQPVYGIVRERQLLQPLSRASQNQGSGTGMIYWRQSTKKRNIT